jgi:hypothetical protein
MLTQLDLILDCFARRDRLGLEDLLSPDYTYYEVSKANFLDRLEAFWQEWEATSTLSEPLQVVPGSCCSKGCDTHLGKNAYKFRSPDGKCLDLRFVLVPNPSGGYLVKDIYPCHQLLTFERVEGPDSLLTFWVYEDDKRGTELPENYPILLHQAQHGLANWKELIGHGPVDFSQLHDWLHRYEVTYHDCGEWIDLGEIVWRWDGFLQTYHDVELFVSFVEEFEAYILCFSVGGYSDLPEGELLPLILDIERRLELRYTVIHGTDFDIQVQADFSQLCINCRTTFALEGTLLTAIQAFRGWFEQERSKLLLQYFALTSTERDEFLETADSPFELYQVGTMLSFHLQTRERFRKQGIFIPFWLGGEIRTAFQSDT